MSAYEARHMVEALRSGVPSKAVGAYFNEARASLNTQIQEQIQNTCDSGKSGGMVIVGRYGEGKTHLLNGSFYYGTTHNMVVSLLSLGKETPMDKPYLLYQKLMENTYLPGAKQPGVSEVFEEMTAGDTLAQDLLDYTSKKLSTDKLFYMLKALWGTSDETERQSFLADLEGDFTSNTTIRKSYKRVTGQACKFDQNFVKTKHAMDYFHFMSHFFRAKGYGGWLILLDEAELLGKLGKKGRINSYKLMGSFLFPEEQLEGVYTLLAFSDSYPEDVLVKKKDQENVDLGFEMDPEAKRLASAAISAILTAQRLESLTREEIGKVLLRLQSFHGEAYDWKPENTLEELLEVTEEGGHALRTKVRAAIEHLDQQYQYGANAGMTIGALQEDSLEEEEEEEEEEEDEDEEEEEEVKPKRGRSAKTTRTTKAKA